VTFSGSPQPREVWSLTVGGTRFDLSIGETYTVAGTADFAGINAKAYLARAALPGATTAPVVGETWTVTVRFGGYVATASHTATTGNTLADVMLALANGINALGETPFLAQAEGENLVLANGSPWLPTVEFTRGVATLAPTVTAHTRLVADSAQALVTIFADRINGLGGFHAIVSDNALVIVKRGGTGFAAFETRFRFIPALDNTTDLYDVDLAGSAASIELVGAPVVGEKWTITLGGLSFDYTVVRDDSLANVARALAERINAATSAADYVASVEGDRLVVVKTSAGAFASGITVTPANGATEQSLVADAVTPSRYQRWRRRAGLHRRHRRHLCGGCALRFHRRQPAGSMAGASLGYPDGRRSLARHAQRHQSRPPGDRRGNELGHRPRAGRDHQPRQWHHELFGDRRGQHPVHRRSQQRRSRAALQDQRRGQCPLRRRNQPAGAHGGRHLAGRDIRGGRQLHAAVARR
jgi:hypothetical protein